MFVVQVREANILDSSQIKELGEQLGYNVPETGVRSSLEYLIKDNCHEIKKEWVEWINGAKKVETRAKRIEKAITELLGPE